MTTSTYFRIIVKNNGAFLFRTSKIHNPTVAFNIAKHLQASFLAGDGAEVNEVNILQVAGQVTGTLITEDALLAQTGENEFQPAIDQNAKSQSVASFLAPGLTD